MTNTPKRIVCLSAEAADWLWRIGAWEDVAGVTAFFATPLDVAPRPRVSGFSTAHFEEISDLQSDLIITFSDVQATLAAELVRRGFPVLATNQRTLAETEATLALLGRIVGRETASTALLEEFRRGLAAVEKSQTRPRVYFEEWNDPLVSGIAWVSELIERAGGNDIFGEFRSKRSASERVVRPEEVCRRNPEVILASWCGKPVRPAEIAGRPGWDAVAAVKAKRIFEIEGQNILQPGFRLVYGYELISEVLRALGDS
jgi:iron complex transport system substrate-binding protein